MNTRPKADRNTRLMRAMGSKNGAYDPEPPDDWLYVLVHGKCDTDRGMAWIKSKTTAHHHNSPYCVDEHGKALHAEHMAVDIGWELQTARNVLSELGAQGRARVDSQSRIWHCADNPMAHQPRSNGLKTKHAEYSVQSIFDGYLLESIRTLPVAKRVLAEARYRAVQQWKNDRIAEAIGAVRSMAERYEDTILRDVGIKKRRLDKKDQEVPSQVKLKLLQEPNFVQSIDPEFVQTAEEIWYKAENGSVHSTHKNKEADTDTDTTTTAPELVNPTPSVPAASVVVVVPLESVLETLRQYGTTTPKAAKALLEECRKRFEPVTAAEIVGVIRRIAEGFSKSTRNPIGVLLKEVPEHFENYERPQEKKVPAARSRTRQEQAEDLAAVIQVLDDSPNHVNAREFESEIEAVRKNDRRLYEEAVKLARQGVVTHA